MLVRRVQVVMEHSPLELEAAPLQMPHAAASPLANVRGVDLESPPAATVDVEASRQAVAAQTRTRKRTSVTTTVLLTAFTIVFTAVVQWLIRYYGDDGHFWQYQFPILTIANLLLLLGTTAGLVWQSVARGRRMRNHALVLVEDTSCGSVGALIDVLKGENFDAHNAARQALTQQLPRLRPDEGRLLTEQHRASLNRILSMTPEEIGHKDVRELFSNTSRREADFRVAILHAYQQIGDAAAIPVVEALATRKATTEARKRIKAAAEECLPYLRVAADRQHAHASLLRGSSGTPSGHDTLVRPAAASDCQPATELLRPNQAP